MSKFDPRAAERIASGILARQNPPEVQVEDINESKVTEFFEALYREGIQVSSLQESQLRGHCERLGLSDSQITNAIEEWMSWGVTDDVSNE
jgi:hypothetical protein